MRFYEALRERIRGKLFMALIYLISIDAAAAKMVAPPSAVVVVVATATRVDVMTGVAEEALWWRCKYRWCG